MDFHNGEIEECVKMKFNPRRLCWNDLSQREEAGHDTIIREKS